MNNDLNKDTQNWKSFKIGNLFDIYPTKAYKDLTNDDLNDGGNTPFVINSAENNGIGGYSTLSATEKAGVITFSDTTDGNTFFYQPFDFIGFPHVQCMHPIGHYWTENQALFLVAILMFHNKGLFNYGRKMRRDIISNTEIKLPVLENSNGTPVIDESKKYSDDGFIPNWQFMDDYIKSLHHKPITTKRAKEPSLDLNIDKWESFKIENLFSKIYKAKAHTKEEVVETTNGMNFVSRTEENNGIDLVVENDNLEGIEKGNCITIGDTTATCFYQKDEFVAGDHMVVLRSDWMNQSIGLFIVTELNLEKYRYSYGRAYKMDSIKSTLLKLPIQRDEQGIPIIDNECKYHSKGFIPDWKFMEDYINTLPFSDRI